jgi:hypothetical protein
MFNQIFYFSTLRKYVILVGALFDDIYVKRFDDHGNETELIEVPITYAAKDKMLARVMQDPGIDRPTATLPLPCISFEMGQMKYDGARKLNTTGYTSGFMDPLSANNFLMQYNPVPYNIDFKVYIYGKNVEDANKVLEQVLPYFTPDWTTAVKLMPEMGIVMDIPVVLHDVQISDNYDKTYAERRAIIYTLDLVVKGYFYGPIKSKPIIKFSNTSFYVVTANVVANSNIIRFANGTVANCRSNSTIANSSADLRLNPKDLHWQVGHTPRSEYEVTTPGLDANGNPVFSYGGPDVVVNSIPIGEIWASNDYGYCETIYHGDGT